MKEIKPEEIKDNPYKLVGKDWMLITAEKDGKVNTMTASWGCFGHLWEKNVALCFIRQTRYTKEFVDGSDTFSLCFFAPKDYQKKLAYLGRVSGRDEDKIAKAGLTVQEDEKAPYFKEARLVIICRKIARVPLKKDQFIDPSIDKIIYSDKNYHDMYIGEIIKVLSE
jgi:flavin reductase (DIM6/NTAB) family NADH-FMN oxidoreductase RutF